MSADLQYIETGAEEYVAQYAFLLDMQANAVFIVNQDASIIYANSAFCQLSGSDVSAVSGKKVREVLSRFKRVDALVRQSLLENKTIVYNDTLRHYAYDQILPLIFNIVPLISHSNNSVAGALVTVQEDSQQLIRYFNQETEKLSQRILMLSDELRGKLKLINAIFDHAPVGMMILDDNCTIMQINQAGRDIFESQSSLVGVSAKRFYHIDDSVLNASCGSIFKPVETKAITAEKNEKSLLRCSVRSRDGDDLIYETFVDISEINNARLVSEYARDEAERANQAKSNFLANVTHELQTPLNIIMGYSQLGSMVSDDVSIDEVRGNFKKILDSGDDLSRFINNLLDISKAEAGKLVFHKQTQLLAALISLIVNECNVLGFDKGIRLCVNCSDDLGEYNLDASRFKQVLCNLIANAIRFSPENSEIEIMARKASDHIDIRVLDRGPGIPEDELEIIFSQFEQSTSNSVATGGTGLGLAICREIISGHNGRIYAENREEGGAVFVIRLPIIS